MPPLEDQLSEAPGTAGPLRSGVVAVLCRGIQTLCRGIQTRPAADPRVDQVRQLAVALARGAGALDLRLARLCCYVQEQDLRGLGYGSFGSFPGTWWPWGRPSPLGRWGID